MKKVNILYHSFYFFLNQIGFKSHWIKTSFGTMHVLERSPQSPRGTIVLVHGIAANSAHYAYILSGLFQAGYRLWVPDLLGHGRSTDLKGEFSLERFFNAFVECLEPLKDSQLILIGNSLGGALSLRFCSKFSKRIEKLVLISPAGGFANEREWEQFRSQLQFHSWQSALSYLEKLYHRPPVYLPLMTPLFRKSFAQKTLQSLLRYATLDAFRWEKIVDDNLWPQTLLIWGQSEKIFPRNHLDWFKKALPQERCVIDESQGIGHCPQIEKPQWLIERLLKFFKNGH